jgi:DNA-binding beta-propeller fold protein YncE
MKRFQVFPFLALVLSVFLLSSCNKEKDEPAEVIPQGSSRVLIACEGDFGATNASISAYDSENNELLNQAFQQANGYGLGSILQSLSTVGDKLYAVVNNSSKIEVMDLQSLQAESPILGLTSPRYMLEINPSKAYVSDLFSGAISIIDLDNKTLTGQIAIGSWTEEMIRFGDFAYVTAVDTDQIYILNVNTDVVVDSIQVTAGPIAIMKDQADRFWVLCNGYFGLEAAKLHRIDPITSTVTMSLDIPQPYSYQMRIAMNPARDRVYVMNNTVFSLGINQTSLPTTPVVPFAGNAYSLGVSPENGDIYIGDALGFSGPGLVYRYSASGEELDVFEVGVGPGNFLFE